MLVPVFKKLIYAYHWLISPWLGSRCRYAPSCSDYAIQALDRYGATQGSLLTIKRMCRCHPWGGEGYDPVPEKNTNIDTISSFKRQKPKNTP